MSRAWRMLRHLLAAPASGGFSGAVMARIGEAIAAGERLHGGEVVFAVESALPPMAAWRGVTPRERAEEVFAQLRVWDTEANNGVLVYLLLADHAIEIVADRGLGRITPDQWQAACEAMRAGLAAGQAGTAVTQGVAMVSALLAHHVPATGAGRDELPDRPVRL